MPEHRIGDGSLFDNTFYLTKKRNKTIEIFKETG